MKKDFLKLHLKTILAFSFILMLMSVFRGYFLLSLSPNKITLSIELLNIFLVGFRLDLVVLSYFYLIIHIVFSYLLFKNPDLIKIQKYQKRISRYTQFSAFIMITILICDYIFYSYFAEHINILFFGVIEDDTYALMQTAFKNYNVPLFIFALFILFFIILFTIKKIYLIKMNAINRDCIISTKRKIFVFLIETTLLVLFMRGSFFTMQPIIVKYPDVSTDKFLNSMTTNGILSFYDASFFYYQNKTNQLDILKITGYKNNETQIFKDFLQKEDIDTSDLLNNIKHITDFDEDLEKNPPHVVVIMVESFGMPILKYQSPTFDIMLSLKKHFEEDIVFTNCISGGNGTIHSLEPFLLNFIQIPNALSYGQGIYAQTAFKEAAAKVYQGKGYQTSFVYGGDLCWQNIGNFMKYQGFDTVFGKGNILDAYHLDENDENIHPWGVFDHLTLNFAIDILQKAKKPQFIFVLTTNNHPPYITPSSYKGECSSDQ